MSDGKLYWLKLKRDFFRRHDIRIIHGMDNGREIVLFYIELMIESIDHEGTLRFSKTKPYTNGMLASLTETPIEIVEQAMNTLIDLGLVEIAEDKTIVLPKVIEMIDSAVDSDTARRQRRYREAQKEQALQNVTGSVTGALRNVTECVTKSNEGVTDSVTNSNESIEIRDKRLEIRDKSIDISFSGEKNKKFEPPTVEEVYEYCESRHNGIDAQLFVDYNTARGWRGIKDWEALIRVWENNPNTYRKDTES